jgi:hypothetical protein
VSEHLRQLEEMEDVLVGEVSGPGLMEYTKGVSRWVRVSGTAEEVESMRYVAGVLAGFGYETKLTLHPGFISVPVRASLELEAPEAIRCECITHSFAPSTPVTGLVGELVGRSSPAIAGKVVLTQGLPDSYEVLNLQKFGAKAVIFVQDECLHKYACSPIWGAPTEETEGLLPCIPVVSITRKEGAILEKFLNDGRARVRIETVVDTGWRDIPVLEAELPAVRGDKFLLFSSHIDSWDFGAMDNGAANATVMEVARVLASRREFWQRGLRLVFWAGHSQGKFAGSAWYADHHFEALEKNCIGHIYADSTGGMDAVVITEAPVMPQTRRLAAAVIKKQTGEEFVGKRIGHYADQSFFGIGLTSVYGTFSEQDAEKNRHVLSFKTGSDDGRAGGLGWWWHSCHDTIDKIDAANLVRDTRIYAATAWRLLTQPVLPYDFREAVADMERTVQELREGLEGRFDFGPLAERLGSLAGMMKDFYAASEGIAAPGEAAERVNDKLLQLSRRIVRITFHDKDCFGFDLSGPMYPIPSLAKGRRLAKVTDKSHRHYVLATELQRGCNRVMHYLAEAMEVLQR